MVNQYVTLPRNVSMPMVGFGTWRLHGEEAYRATLYALQVGYRHIDTATMYRNEAEIGQAVRDSGVPRAEVFLTTKLQPSDAGREREVLERSLTALGTDYLDLWLIHAPPRRHDGAATWREFLAARDAGQVRAVGVSNYELEPAGHPDRGQWRGAGGEPGAVGTPLGTTPTCCLSTSGGGWCWKATARWPTRG